MDLRGQTVHILHVDDDPGIRDLTETLLARESEDEPFEVAVETAGGAGAGLDRLDCVDGEVDCVVSDYDMPRTDGLELLEAVRADHPDLPFILFTGKGSEEIASDAISAGVTDYLQKGGAEQYGVLLNRVRNAVRQYWTEQALRERERQLSERNRELEESRRRLSTLVANLPGLVYRCRNERTWPMEYVGGDCEGVTGYDADALEDGDVVWSEDVLAPADTQHLWEQVQAALDAREAFEVTYHIETADGERKRVWERGRGVFEGGDLVGIEGFITDLTERVRREADERERHEFVEGVVEAIDDICYAIDAEGCLEWWNARLPEVTGYSDANLDGMSIERLLVPEDRETLEPVREALRTGSAGTGDLSLLTADGERLPYEARAVERTDAEGTVVGWCGIARDVSDRADRQQDLERRNERLERFASVMSHDLKNPLQVAQTRLDLLTEDVDSPHADAIDRSLERMDDIVSDVLRLAQEGRVVRDPEVVDAGAVIEEAWGTVDTEGATLDHEGGACRLRADPGRVRTLLENLFANAVEHGDDPTVRVGTLDNGDGFYVADDGPGIPDDEREEVFRYGYSLSAGSGLGLAIVEAVADAHGWTVTAGESESGGARFEFRGVDLI